MGLIFSSFFAALGQLGDRRFLKVLGLGVALTLALLVGAYAGLLWLIEAMVGPEAYVPLIGEVTWLNDLLSGASFIFMLVLSIFLMVPVASAITSLFLEDVARAVEDEHYPGLPPVARVSFGDGLRDTLNFLGVLILANTLALILYAIFSPIALFIFWGLNGFLLGREYFTLVAMRRLGRVGAIKLRKQHRATIWAAGVLMAAPLSIPLINLFVPILGAATFTHLYHGMAKTHHPSG